MKRIAIIGGGISGLSAALFLEKPRLAGLPLEYVVFESSARFGGVLRTESIDGCVVEAGPDSFLTEKPWAAELCRELGLGDQLIGSNDATRKTYILVNGRLIAMPDGLMFMVPTKILPVALSPLFSFATKCRMVREWFCRPQSGADETVASLVERHYGRELVERLADPLLSGVYGGESSQLGVRAVLPRFVEMEEKYGSLSKAMLAARRKTAAPQSAAKPLFTSLKSGMQQLADALLARLPKSSMKTDATVQSLHPEGGGWNVSHSAQTETFDAVIVANPAPQAAALLRTASSDLAAELAGIPYTSSVTVTLGYEGSVRASLPEGFGFLVPRAEGKRLLAATFVHNKFPFRAPPERTLVRCFLGGARDSQVLDLSDDEIVRTVRAELQQILRLTAQPRFTRVYRWRGAMAQYGVGHLQRLDRIAAHLAKLPTLALAGNAYRGIGVPDCVRSGSEAAQRVLSSVGLID
jgi:oxygen-dependent protoporphyrinogen oxidase